MPACVLESVNVGQPRTEAQDAGREAQAPMTSAIWKQPVTGPVWLDTNGLHGDRVADSKVHGGPWRAVLMYSSDHFPRWRQEWNRRDVTAGAFGENLTVRAIQESTACLGDRFELGEALIEVTSPRGPCWKLARRHGVPDLVSIVKANHRHGWYLRVLKPGWIEAGQAVILVDRPYPQWTIDRVGRVRWDRSTSEDEVQLLTECPALIPDWREYLRQREVRL
jgi:MOSC domain-containing protein YiiM